jgi:hypothetical protein
MVSRIAGKTLKRKNAKSHTTKGGAYKAPPFFLLLPNLQKIKIKSPCRPKAQKKSAVIQRIPPHCNSSKKESLRTHGNGFIF